jgi:ADP-heptose:LPS heptosyltransferase
MLRKQDVGIVGNLQLHKLGSRETIHGAGSQWDWTAGVFRHIGKEIYNHVLVQKPFALDNAPRDIFKAQEREMVTGACLGIRKELFEELGGFNPNYRIGYWEDSDLCMTVREKGYKVMYQPASKIYHKGSHSGAGGHKYAHHNTNYFKNKWINSGRIDALVDAPRPTPLQEVGNIVLKRTSAHGDALMAAAVAAGLKKKYPRCKVMFNTACPEVAEKSPYIDKVIKAYELSERTFQLFYNLDMAYEFRPKSNILQAYADVVGVDVEDCELFLHTEEVKGLPEDYIVLHAGNTGWAGRDWSLLRFEVLANKLLKNDYKTVLVGSGRDHYVSSTKDLKGRTTIHELAYIMKNARMFVGIDSFPMHVAQTFNTPGVVFFGSINPATRLIRDNIRTVKVDGLPCLGCHHRQPAPCTVTVHCETGTKECVNGISIEEMYRNVEEVWKQNTTV